MKLRYTLTLALLFLAAGLMFLYGPVTQYYASKNVAVINPSVVASNSTPATNASIQGKPVRIIIPSVKINIPVIEGYYDAAKQDWTLTDKNAQYATITAPANNQTGNTFIYGHNQAPVFGRLPKVKVGDKAIVLTNNGHRLTYTFSSSRETVPSDDSLFRYEGEPILTLQTCSGLFSQNRELFTFKLSEAV